MTRSHARHRDLRRPAARDLIERYPEIHDGWDRLGMLYEARGENRQAADCYRTLLAFVREHPYDFDASIIEGVATVSRRITSLPAVQSSCRP